MLNRKARRHYGVSSREVFNRNLHPASCKEWDDIEECFKAGNRMVWHIKKGQTVSSTAPILLPFYRVFSPQSSKTVTSQLIYCDANSAPAGFESKPGSATQVACKMVINLQSVPEHLWREQQSPSGQSYSRLDYELGVQIESGGLRFDLRVDGVVYGKVVATFK